MSDAKHRECAGLSDTECCVVFDLINDGILVFDAQANKILDANRRAMEMWGYSKDEFEELDPAKLSSPSPESEQTCIKSLISSAGDEPFIFEWTAQRKNGETFCVEVTVRKTKTDDRGMVYMVARDVSQRNIYEEQLRETVRRYRMLLGSVSEVIWTLDLNGRFTYFSPSVTKAIGYSPEEAMNFGIANLLTPESARVAQKIIADIHSSLERGEGFEPGQVELEHVRRDGVTYWDEVSYQPLLGADGQIEGILGVSRNIEARKQAEDKLKRERELTKKIINTIPGAFYMTDEEGRCLWWNDYTIRELITHQEPDGSYDVMAAVLEEDRPKAWLSLEKAFSTGYANSELRLRHTDGSIRHYYIVGARVDLDEKAQVVGIGLDITRRKRAEEGLRQSLMINELNFANNPLAMIEWDNEFRVTRWNPAAERIFGYSAEEAIGQRWFFIVPPEERAVVEALKDQLPSQNSGISSTNKNVTKDGRIILCEWHNTTITDPDNNIIGTTSTAQDITESVKAEAEIKESARRFGAIFDQSPIGIALVDSESGIFQQVNSAFAKMVGRSKEELFSLTYLDVTHPEEKDDLMLRQNQLHQGEVDFLQWDKRYVRPDGSIIWGRATVIPMRAEDGTTLCNLAMIVDITERRQMEQDKRLFYRNTILAATDGILSICDDGDVLPYINSSRVTANVCDPAEVSLARAEVETACSKFGLSGDDLAVFAIAAGEAITNAVKHANCGTVSAGQSDGEIWVAVSDEGPGIESLILPSAVLRRGFSTKPSLGLGYSIMLDIADRILLKTDTGGTTVVLIKKIVQPEASIDNIPDTWIGVKQM